MSGHGGNEMSMRRRLGIVLLLCVGGTGVHAQGPRSDTSDADASANPGATRIELSEERFETPEMAAIERHWQELTESAGDPAIGAGAGEARATLIEFIDYACPHCRKAAPVVLRLAEEHPQLRVVFKEFPILGEASYEAARASVAAARQPGWRAFHEALMGSPPGLSSDEAIYEAAVTGGLDLERLARDIESAETAQVIERSMRLARSLGVASTPSVVARNGIGNVLMMGGVSRRRLERFLALDLEPGNAESHVRLGRELHALARRGFRTDETLRAQALKALTEAIRVSPSDPKAYVARALLRRGRRSWSEEEYARTLRDYTEAIRLDPDDPALYIRRAEFLEDDEDTFLQAIEDYETAIRLEPNNPSLYLSRARAWMTYRAEKGDYPDRFEQAARDYDHAVRLGPDHRRAHAARAIFWAGRAKSRFPSLTESQKRRYREEALRSYDEAIRIDSTDPFLYNQRGWVRIDVGHDRAMEDFDQAVRLEPDVANRYGNRAKASMRLGNSAQAIADYSEAIRLDPKGGDWYWARAHAWSQLGNDEQALRDYDALIELEPGKPLGYILRARFWKARGENDRAIRDYDQAIRMLEGIPKKEWYDARTDLQLKEGRYREAVRGYEEAIRDFEQASRQEPLLTGLNGVQADYCNALAWLLATGPVEIRDGARAVELARKAVEIFDYATYRDTLAAALVEAGEIGAAIAEYETAIGMEPRFVEDYQEMLEQKGFVVTVNGVYDEATRRALYECVRSGCQLVELDDVWQ